MNSDPKQRIFLMVALMLTFMLIMQYIFPTPPQENREVVPARHTEQTVAPAAPGGAAPVLAGATEFNPGEDYEITIRRGGADKNANGYEAVFSTVGGGLSRYKLLGYHREPQDDSPENRIVLLDRLASGRDSLRIAAVTHGTNRSSRQTTPLEYFRYELLEVPADAEVSPAPGDSVKRGDNLVLRAVVGEWELIRTYRFPAGAAAAAFTIPFDMQWRNLGDVGQELSYTLVGPAGMVADDDSPQFGLINFLTARQASPSSPGVEIERMPLSDVAGLQPMSSRDNRASLAFVGAKNRFFTAIVTADNRALADSNGATRLLFPGDPAFLPSSEDMARKFRYQPEIQTAAGPVPGIEEVSLTLEPGAVAAGAVHTASYQLYAGPAVDELLTGADARLEGVVSYTWRYFDFISRWMVKFLTFLDQILGNYGLAIIAMTVLIKLVLHPLNRKSFVSMNKLSMLAPQMKEIQKKHANDKVKMQQELGKLHRDNGVSMAGGCLPIFLQLPIFFALYGAFSQGFSMRHAPFLAPWISDLSKPDSVYDFGTMIPVLNSSHISLLPVLYFVLQYAQMSLQPTPTDPQQAQQQKIMKFMPLLFVFVFYSMPAGLVLYFTVSALCSVIESAYIRKVVLPRLGLGGTPAAAQVAAAGAKAGAGVAQAPAKKAKKK